MPTPLPTAVAWTAAANQGEAQTWGSNVRAFLAGLLGTDGAVATARSTLGLGSAAVAGAALVSNGTAFIEVPDVHDNLIINGSFEINQRGSASVADDVYCLDRFYILTESGSVTVAQITDPEAGAPWGIRLTQPDAVAKRMGLATIIESKDCRHLRSAVATLAARVKLSTGGVLRYALLEHTGTADSVTSDVVSNWASATFTPGNFFISGVNVLQCGTTTPGAATWGDLAGYGTVGASMNNLVCVIWTEAAAAQNVTLDINRFRCVPGTIALPHRFRPGELALAQRYYETGVVFGAGAINPTTTYFGFNVFFKQTKRSTPNISKTDTAAATTAGGAAVDGCYLYTLSTTQAIQSTWVAEKEL